MAPACLAGAGGEEAPRTEARVTGLREGTRRVATAFAAAVILLGASFGASARISGSLGSLVRSTRRDGLLASLTAVDVPEYGIPGVSVYSLKYWSRGVLVQGYLDVPSGKGPFPLLVLLHGGWLYAEPYHHDNYAGPLWASDSPVTASQWASYKAIVFLPNYAGYGPSDGTVQTLGPNASDALNGMAALRQICGLRIKAHATYLLGESMGGGVAVYLAERDQHLRGAVLFSPALFNSPTWATQAYDVHLPILIIAGTQDTTVLPEIAQWTAQILSVRDKHVQLVFVGGGHVPLAAGWGTMLSWYARHGLTLVQSLSTRAPRIGMCDARP